MRGNGPIQSQPIIHFTARIRQARIKQRLYNALIGLARKEIREKGDKQINGSDQQKEPQGQNKTRVFKKIKRKPGFGFAAFRFLFLLWFLKGVGFIRVFSHQFKKYFKAKKKQGNSAFSDPPLNPYLHLSNTLQACEIYF